RVEAYANAFLEVARAEGYLTDIEDELYRFARAFESFDDLRMALTDQALPASIALAGMVVAAGRAHDLPVIVDRFVSEAAQERDQEVAEVRSAVPLDAGQQQRLAAALARATGKQVEIKVVIDPTVLGGIVARVGDVVIDGSVRHRLEQLKEQI